MAIEEVHMNFLEKTLKLIDQYGIWKTIRALLVIATFVFITCNAPGFFDRIIEDAMNRQQVEAVEQHNAALEVRQNAKPEIDKILNETLLSLDGDRTFIIEMHNGTNNTSGLPFLYGEMTYETVSKGINHIDDDYTRLNLSRFNLAIYLQKTHVWCGSIQELHEIDEKLALRMASNDVTYFAIVQISGVTNELGYFGVTYCGEKTPKDDKEIRNQLYSASQRLSILLDMSQINE